jgi:hypothetical protein
LVESDQEESIDEPDWIIAEVLAIPKSPIKIAESAAPSLPKIRESFAKDPRNRAEAAPSLHRYSAVRPQWATIPAVGA